MLRTSPKLLQNYRFGEIQLTLRKEQVGAEAAAKRLQPCVIVLLSADGAAVDRAYLRMFNEDTLALVVEAEELPVPFIPHSGGSIPVRKVGER